MFNEGKIFKLHCSATGTPSHHFDCEVHAEEMDSSVFTSMKEKKKEMGDKKNSYKITRLIEIITELPCRLTDATVHMLNSLHFKSGLCTNQQLIMRKSEFVVMNV